MAMKLSVDRIIHKYKKVLYAKKYTLFIQHEIKNSALKI